MAPSPKLQSEQDLAAIVVGQLKLDGFDVYQEVQPYRGGPIADIVATAGPLLCVVECKMSLNFDVLAQCQYWTQYAHHVIAACPSIKGGTNRWQTRKDILEAFGIGFTSVSDGYARNILKPRLNRKAVAYLIRKVLCEEQKTLVAAGGNRGGYYTPFKGTCEEVRQYVQKNPGVSLKETLTAVKHHYSSVASGNAAMGNLILAGKVPGLVATRVKGKVLLEIKEGTQ